MRLRGIERVVPGAMALGLLLAAPLAMADDASETRLYAVPVTPGLVPPALIQPSPGTLPHELRYPQVALHQRAEGTAVVRARIGADGSVEQVWLKESSGHTSLDRAAVSHVLARRFVPATRDGNAVALVAAIPVTFDLPDR